MEVQVIDCDHVLSDQQKLILVDIAEVLMKHGYVDSKIMVNFRLDTGHTASLDRNHEGTLQWFVED